MPTIEVLNVLLLHFIFYEFSLKKVCPWIYLFNLVKFLSKFKSEA
jgi:hypothetical protein